MKELKPVKINDHHYQVDMRGWMCPYPKYAIEMLLEKLPWASLMDLLVDCPAATKDVPAVVRSKGCEVREVYLITDGEWRIRISK
ncbi:sulfurtransferase TusA family protein [Moorellaceae bacterium AZ2]